MKQVCGWLLDVYPDLGGAKQARPGGSLSWPGQGLLLWLLGDDGQRYCLRQPFPITFYAAGPPARLKALRLFVESQPGPRPVVLFQAWRKELFSQRLLEVQALQLDTVASQALLFNRISQAFPDLTYFDTDIPLPLRHAARFGTFPLARCAAAVDAQDTIQELQVLDSPWELDPLEPPLRILRMEPEPGPDAGGRPPTHLLLHTGGQQSTLRLALQPERPLLVNLRALLTRLDPDLLLTAAGDTWMLPYLLERARIAHLPLPLNRDPQRQPAHRPERSYFSYGQVIYRGRQVHLFGRWHIDRGNAMLWDDYNLQGVLEVARVTGLPVQTAARVSPGTGISSMQILTALRNEILVPWHKQQAETPKTALQMFAADQGGLVYQPLVGLHHDVGEIDFVSMYPGIMVHFNISPETVRSQGPSWQSQGSSAPDRSLTPFPQPDPAPGETSTPAVALPAEELLRTPPPLPAAGDDPDDQLGSSWQGQGQSWQGQGPSWQSQGLIPKTLSPLLNKRLALKAHLAAMRTDPSQRWDPRCRAYEARSSAHKWLLVTCFGYLGYKNARFGRIEAHEAVTAYGREALLRAKEAAEDLGFTVLHLYVDGLWVKKPGASRVADFQPLLDAISERTGLPIALDGVYRWVAFVPSRIDARWPVPNRYFGVFQDGSLKVRGIEARRDDTPPFIAEVQMQLLELLAKQTAVSLSPQGSTPSSGNPPSYDLAPALALLHRKLRALRQGRVPLQELVVNQKLSQEIEAYRQPSAAARAAMQLQGLGRSFRPGQRVRFLYTLGKPGVAAWDLPWQVLACPGAARTKPGLSQGLPPYPAALDLKRYTRLLLRAAHAALGPFGISEAQLSQLVVDLPARQLKFSQDTVSRPDGRGLAARLQNYLISQKNQVPPSGAAESPR